MGRAAYLRVGEAHFERTSHRTTIAPLPYRLRLLGVICVCALSLAGVAQAAPRGHEALGVKLARALRAPGVSRSAAVAVELSTGKVVYARNARLPLIPASNEKLAVTYAALVALGPAYRIETQVLGLGEQDAAEWHGDLVLKGFGDPSLSSLGLRRLAAEVRGAGIRVVTGRILGDESYFDAFRMGPGWKPYFFINESPPLSALTVDRGRYLGRTSRTPALAAAVLFRKALTQAGVRVAGPARLGTVPPDAEGYPVASLLSPPLSSILRFMDYESDNFTAEILLKQLGTLESGQGTTAAGALAVRRILGEYGVPMDGVRIADGSGLSRLNRLTAVTLVQMLRSAWVSPDFRNSFFSSLPVAARSGTLERRMIRTAAAGRVRAKTGTTRESSALSGIVKDRYAFSILQNGYPVATWSARRSQDRFAAILAAS
jgi:D-alanyl-D-alanine carboxypeptidase/D-alanyl-D-alanine-endopeptidase (penicillin-binding protein 4)